MPILMFSTSILMSAEAFGLIWFAIQEDDFFYTRTQIIELPEKQIELFSDGILFHPYLGFSHYPHSVISPDDWVTYCGGDSDEYQNVPQEQLTRNNHGYKSLVDYPYLNTNNEYLIGIFGGSVAHAFSIIARDSLINNLQKHPFFKDKNIRILNFSQPKFKQPQLLLSLIYFLALEQEFHMIINLDGFNEVALAGRNHDFGRHIAMPSIIHLIPLLGRLGGERIDLHDIQKLLKLRTTRQSMADAESRLKNTLSAAFYLVNNIYHSFLSWNHYRLSEELEESLMQLDFSKLTSLSPAASHNLHAAMQNSQKLWSKNSNLMHQITKANNIQYFQFLQPNQYYSSKEFNVELSEEIYSKESPFLEKVQIGYPLLRKAGKDLNRKGIHFKDLSTLFEPPSDVVYVDNCCHLSVRGNNEVANVIATYILAHQNEKTFQIQDTD